MPARIIDKSLASDRVIIDTLVAKYCDHVPLYRQSAILERETGVEISLATMDGWVLRVGELLSPIAMAVGRELVNHTYLQADETPVGVQMHDGRGKNHQAYIWQYGRPGGSVVFDFQLGRGREGPKRFLAQFDGILQTDGYAAYQQVGGPKIVHACCWAHSRRKFIEALKLHPDDRIAARLVASIDALFAIDAEARSCRSPQTTARTITPAARCAEARHRSCPAPSPACQCPRQGVKSIQPAYQMVLNHNGTAQQPPKIGRDGKWQLNLYDPDLTRVELMEFKPVETPCCSAMKTF